MKRGRLISDELFCGFLFESMLSMYVSCRIVQIRLFARFLSFLNRKYWIYFCLEEFLSRNGGKELFFLIVK